MMFWMAALFAVMAVAATVLLSSSVPARVAVPLASMVLPTTCPVPVRLTAPPALMTLADMVRPDRVAVVSAVTSTPATSRAAVSATSLATMVASVTPSVVPMAALVAAVKMPPVTLVARISISLAVMSALAKALRSLAAPYSPMVSLPAAFRGPCRVNAPVRVRSPVAWVSPRSILLAATVVAALMKYVRSTAAKSILVNAISSPSKSRVASWATRKPKPAVVTLSEPSLAPVPVRWSVLLLLMLMTSVGPIVQSSVKRELICVGSLKAMAPQVSMPTYSAPLTVISLQPPLPNTTSPVSAERNTEPASALMVMPLLTVRLSEPVASRSMSPVPMV
ncbi:MAG: hypothetical protein BWX73_01263 [Lentisphaerae bacterium ADurb.Bin082]|nr:MAG: hypothetical protein BWX73_01263 [Lentisphaerae bacterium ADurb.Bin082]